MTYFRKFFLSVTFVFLFAPQLCAQVAPEGSRSGSWEERYKDDSAICLLDETDTYVNADGTSTTRTRMVFKIQKESAKELGEVPLSYDSSYQEVKDLSAFVTMPDGRKLKYTKIQELSEYSGYPVYSNEKTKIVTLPEVNIGSTLERDATIVNKKAQIDGQFFDLFSLADSIPIKLLRYRISFPVSMRVNIYSFNMDWHPKKEIISGRIIYTWELNETERDRPEDHSPPAEESSPWVIITTVEDWKVISDWYWQVVSKNMQISDEIKAKTASIIKDKPSQKEEAEAIVKYIFDNFRYVSMSFGTNRFEPHPAVEVFRNKYGDCKDQVTLVLAMLKAAGITAQPALYLNESDGIIYDEAPSPDYFNHVIIVLTADGRTYYVDPLVDGYHIGEIPYFEQGANLFVVNDKGGYRAKVPIQDSGLMTSIKEDIYTIRPDGSAIDDQKIVYDREGSIDKKKSFETMNEEDKKEFYKTFEGKSGGGKILNMSYSDTKDKYSPFVFTSKMELPDEATVQGDFMIIVPAYEVPNLNFITTERQNPIIFYSSSIKKKKVIYNLPAGYRVESLPEDINISTKLFDFVVKYKVSGNMITEDSFLKYKRGRLELKEYPEFQSVWKRARSYKSKFIIARKTI